MLKRRASRMAFFSSSTPSKRQPAPSPRPGRTLVLSSTSSSVDLGHIVEEGFNFDFEKSNHFNNLAAAEPLFNDFFLPPAPSEAPPPPPLPDRKLRSEVPLKVPSLRWSLESDVSVDSEDDDALLDELCSTPAEEELCTAKPISFFYPGKPRLVDVFSSRLSSKQPSLHSDSHSRTSSVSTRDSPLTPSIRFGSDADDHSSPASSISEYSNIVYDTIPEEPSFQVQLPSDARLKPLRRSHGRNVSAAPSNLYIDDLKNYNIKVWDVQPSPGSSISPVDAAPGDSPEIPTEFHMFKVEYGLAA